jgi:hypothetical protein
MRYALCIIRIHPPPYQTRNNTPPDKMMVRIPSLVECLF